MDKWDKRFLKLASEVATWSKDKAKQVGAVITNKDNQVISIGFNGLAKGIADDNRLLNKEWKNQVILHAEENAMLNASASVKGAKLYCTHSPCGHCASLIIQSGIKEVYFPAQEDDHLVKYRVGLQLLNEAGIKWKEITV